MKKKALVLCTGNSCRSQMAEALINERLSESWEAYSAGTAPSGYVHPKALAALEEIGITHPGRSKHIGDLGIREFDAVITVCDDAAQNCPLWLGQGRQQHIGFPDPAKAEGSEAEIMQVFRDVRDAIAEQVLAYLEDFKQA